MRRVLSILVALALSLSFSFVMATPVAAAVLTVDTSQPDIPPNYHTIQAAVDAASSGDTIEVAAGTYTEDVTIPPALTNLTLLGANAGKSAHPDDPDGRGAESVIVGTVSIGISHGSAGVTVDGFRIESDTSSGVQIRGTDITIANTVIVGQDPYPTSGGATGIGFQRGGVNVGDPASFVFHNNRVEGYRYGIQLDGPAADYDASGTSSLISGNYLSNNQRAIQTHGSMHGGTIIHEISGNTIVENERGIRLAGGGFAIVRNIISDNDDYGIQAGAGTVSMDGLTIHYNCILNNGRIGVENGSGLEVSIDATFNWWGDVSGPYHATLNSAGTGDPVSDGVDFDPWLTGLDYTGATSFPEADAVVLQATLSSSDNGAPGAAVDFYVDGDHVGSADTDLNGVAELDIGAQAAGSYEVTVKAAGCFEATAELEVQAAPPPQPPTAGLAYPIWAVVLAGLMAGASLLLLRRRQTQS